MSTLTLCASVACAEDACPGVASNPAELLWEQFGEAPSFYDSVP